MSTLSAAPKGGSKKLEELIKARTSLQKELETVEVQLYKLETTYLQSSQEVGTVLDGWCNSHRGAARKRRNFESTDRIFTLSSATGLATAEKNGLLASASVKRKVGDKYTVQ